MQRGRARERSLASALRPQEHQQDTCRVSLHCTLMISMMIFCTMLVPMAKYSSRGVGSQVPVSRNHPTDRRTDTDLELVGRPTSRSSSFHEVNDVESQLTRIRSMHRPALRESVLRLAPPADLDSHPPLGTCCRIAVRNVEQDRPDLAWIAPASHAHRITVRRSIVAKRPIFHLFRDQEGVPHERQFVSRRCSGRRAPLGSVARRDQCVTEIVWLHERAPSCPTPPSTG